MLQYELIDKYEKAYNSAIDKEMTIIEYVEMLEREMKEYGYETFEEAFESDTDIELIERPGIDEVITFAEATNTWGLADSTLRKLATTNKLVEGEDYRKSGKVWLITKNAMIKTYGKPKDE